MLAALATIREQHVLPHADHWRDLNVIEEGAVIDDACQRSAIREAALFQQRGKANLSFFAGLHRCGESMNAVIEFLERTPIAQNMFRDIRTFIHNRLPDFVADNRSYLTIALGCTGGQHRSVYLAEKLAQHFKTEQQVLLRHREMTRRD